MDRYYIREHGIVDRYLHGVLTEAESDAFEQYLLTDPDLVAEVEQAERTLQREDAQLRSGLQDLDAQGAFPARRPPGRLMTAIASPQYALAATVLLALSIGFSGMLYQENRSRDGFGIESTRLVPVVATRGEGAPATLISVENSAELIVLLIDPGFELYDDYRAVVTKLNNGGGTRVLELANLQPGYEDLLAVGMPGHLLEPGDYEVNVEARQRDEGFSEISRLSFRVLPSP